VLRARLGAGESEAISLALELGVEQLLVDERGARRLAQAVGLSVIGTLGGLLAAKRKGMIAAVGPPVQDLLGRGFWIAPDLVRRALAAASEAAEP
jgi:predicted nucleic acid-binding protein